MSISSKNSSMSKSSQNNPKESKDPGPIIKLEPIAIQGLYENHNPRYTRVGDDYFQAQVPPLINKRSKMYSKYKKHRQLQEVFDPQKVDSKKLEEYLQFAKSLNPETSGPSTGMLMAYSNKMEEKALEFLHEMGYSFTKAKFYLLFPTLLKWNEYSAESPLEISEKEMEEKIAFFITQVQETKTSQQERWKNELQELLSSRVPLSKLMSFIEQGKSQGFKNDIPDFLKDMLNKTATFSKEIKQKLHQKTKLEGLEQLKKQSEEFKIISNEMLELDDSIERSKKWIESAEQLGEGPYTMKDLEMITNDYKNLSLEHEAYHKFKRILDEMRELLEKLANFSKQNKTRYNVVPEKIPLQLGREYADRINNLKVDCEEFDAFLKTLETSMAVIENIRMFFEDERTPKNLQNVTLISKDLLTQPFSDKIQDQIQRYIEYFTVVERMNKNLCNRSKLDEVEDDLKYCKSKGFVTDEINTIKRKLNQLKELYEKSEDFFKTRKAFNVKLLFQSYKVLTNHIPEESLLLKCIAIGEELQVDQALLSDLHRLRDQLQEWKSKIRDDFTFDEMVKGISSGYALGFKCPELASLFEKAKKILIWTIQAINLIKKYEGDFKSKLLNETYSNDLSVIINKNLISFEDDYRQVVFLTNDKPSESFRSMELEKLLQLKEKSESWSRRVNEELQKKRDYNPIVIKSLLEESQKFPTEMALRNQLKEINNFVSWILKAKEVMCNEGENSGIIEKLKERGILILKEKLKRVQEFTEKDAVKFLVDIRRLLTELFQIISQPEIKLKADSFDLDYIEELIGEAQNVKLPEEEKGLVEELNKIVERGRNWIDSYEKLRVIERKKKGGKGGRGRRGHNKREVQEKVKTEVMSESAGNIEVEPEKQMKIEELESEKGDPLQAERVQSEVKSEANWPQGIPGTKSEIFIVDEEEKKVEKPESTVKQEKEKPKPVFNRESDNFFYFFKLPLLMTTLYDGLEVRASVDDLRAIKQYLTDIHTFIESTNVAVSRKLKLDDLEEIITTGGKLKLYLIEIEKCKKLYKWGCSWLYLANQLLNTLPQPPNQIYKKGGKDQGDDRQGKGFDLNQYLVSFDEEKYMFVLTRNQTATAAGSEFDEESTVQDLEISGKHDATPQKRYSKREKKVNRKFQESGFAVYSPELLGLDEKPTKASQFNANGKRPRRRKNSINMNTEKKRKMTSQEIVHSESFVKEDDTKEIYCICRKGHDGLSYMVACDKCSEWFHGECIALPKSYYQKNFDFNCFACVARYNLDPPVESSDFVWNRMNQVELEDFFNLVQEGRMLPLNIPEIDEMIELEQRVKTFIQRIEAEVKKGAQIDLIQNLLELNTMDKVLKEFEKSQMDRERHIKTLYLESLGYPVRIKLTDELIGILQKRDLATEIIKLLNGKQNSKAIKKILSKNYNYIDMENDQELKGLYDKLKSKYEISSKIVDRINLLLENKGDHEEFGRLIKYIEENSMYVEKFDTYKAEWDKFNDWERSVAYAIQHKVDKDTMCGYQRAYVELKLKSSLIGFLNDIISEAEEWQKKALIFINDPQSGIDEDQLINEGHNLRCKIPFVDYLETRRQQWVVNSFMSAFQQMPRSGGA